MARSKKEQSVIITALGVHMTIWQNLVAAVRKHRKHDDGDEDIYRLATEEGQPIIEEIGRLIATGGKPVDAPVCDPKVETIEIAGYSFQQITYPDGGREIPLGEFEIKDESLEDKIAAVGFVAKPDPDHPDGYNTEITSANCPRPTGNKVVRLSLINTGRDRQESGHFEAMTTRLSRTEGDVYQGLEVVRKYPNLQRALYILMFRSGWRNLDGIVVVPVFGGSNDEGWFDLYDYVSDWRDDAWALVAG